MSDALNEAATKLEALRSEIGQLDTVENPTEEQVLRFDAALAEWDVVKADHDKLAARAAQVEAVRTAAVSRSVEPGFSAPNVNVKRDPFEGVESLRMGMHSDDLIARAVTALEETSRGISSDHVEEAVRKVESIPGAAVHALAYGSPAYRSAFRTWGRNNGNLLALSPDEAAAYRAALAVGTGSTGLFAIPTLLDPSIILTGAITKNAVRGLARVVTGTAPTWNGVSAGATTAYWTAEAAAMTDGAPTFAGPAVTAHKMTAYLPGSFEVWEDSMLQSDLIPAIAEAFDNLEGSAFVSGSGSGAPTGVITAVSGTAGSLVTATTRGSFTTASSADVYAMVNAVDERFEDAGTWVANKKTLNVIKQMDSSGGGLFWDNLNNGLPARLLGYDVTSSNAVTSTTTSGNILAILGDFSRYVIYDRLGTFLELDPIVVNGSGLPTGQRAIVAHKRVGGHVTDVNAFRLLKA